MKDSLEDRLERLRPAAPAPALMQRLLAAELATKIVRGPRPSLGVISRIWFPCAAAAAAAALLTLILWPVKPERRSEIFTPVKANSYLVSANDIGVIAPKPDRAYRMVHCVWLEDDAYRGSDGVSTMRVAHAHQEIVPVAMEIY